jgi:death on curing protein
MTLWLSLRDALAIHDEQLAEHGGAADVRDMRLLENALARPLNRAGYGDPDIAELAAVYAFSIVRNHPFVEGNKRTGYVLLETFLELNGALFAVTDAEVVIAILQLAAGDTSEEVFIDWVRASTRVPGE